SAWAAAAPKKRPIITDKYFMEALPSDNAIIALTGSTEDFFESDLTGPVISGNSGNTRFCTGFQPST
ncbi:hypothetical protein, partial [Sphingorhabdus sp.]|uniref:hypothetical protein n=1 Tax=Sphingorhabdus sp. TaxID=1902408 RepID=UPI0032B7BEBD